MAGKKELSCGTPQKNEFPFEWIKEKLGGECPVFTMNDSLLEQFNKLKLINVKGDENIKNLSRVTEIAQIELTVQDERSNQVLELIDLNQDSLPTLTCQQLACVEEHTLDVSLGCDNHVEQSVTTYHAMKSHLGKFKMLKTQSVGDLEQATRIIETMRQENKQLQEELTAREKSCEQSPAEKCEQEKHVRDLQDKRSSLEQSLAATEAAENFQALHSSHKRVVKQQEQLEDLRRERQTLQEQLVKYGDLTPDMTLAQAEVNQLHTKLQDLKGEIAFIVSAMSDAGYM